MQYKKICTCVFFSLILTSAVLFAASAPQVTGKYFGNNKEAKLAYALALQIEDWSGEPAYQLILTEKDPAGAKKPEFDAMFGKLGSALLVKITKSGKVFGTEICHQNLKRSGVSSVGTLNFEKLKIEANTISCRLFTKGPDKVFDETWEADLTIAAPVRTK
jgi:hypothetical protein